MIDSWRFVTQIKFMLWKRVLLWWSEKKFLVGIKKNIFSSLSHLKFSEIANCIQQQTNNNSRMHFSTKSVRGKKKKVATQINQITPQFPDLRKSSTLIKPQPQTAITSHSYWMSEWMNEWMNVKWISLKKNIKEKKTFLSPRSC